MTSQSDNTNFPRVQFQVHFRTGDCGRKHLRKGSCPNKSELPNKDLPRLTRLLALAHRWNHLIDKGVVADYAEIAAMMGLSRARVTQIMDLLTLAPEIQESILLMPYKAIQGLPERAVRRITRLPLWKDQRAECEVRGLGRKE